MKRKIKNIIKYIPSGRIRVFLYKSVFNYKIGENVKIGKSIIDGKKVIINNGVSIGDGCIVKCNELFIDKNASILSNNKIIGKSNFSLGENSRIIHNHTIDLWNNVTIGNNTWLAGKSIEIWTHGSLYTKLHKDLSVKIGDNVYVSSSSKIAPGVNINHNNLIGLGSIVSKSIESSFTIVAGNPAKIVKENVDWKQNW